MFSWVSFPLSADSLRAQLSAARAGGVTTLLDLSGVGFIDASGLRVLLEAAEAASKQEWAWFLVRPSLAVRRLLEVSGTASRLPIVLPDAGAERAEALPAPQPSPGSAPACRVRGPFG